MHGGDRVMCTMYESYIKAVLGVGASLHRSSVSTFERVEQAGVYLAIRIALRSAKPITICFPCSPGEDACMLKASIEQIDVPLGATRVISIVSGRFLQVQKVSLYALPGEQRSISRAA
jgi:hypothetical protein